VSRLRLGTRASRLALTQSSLIARGLERAVPGLTVELVEIRTTGDRLQGETLGPHLGQSFFTKEIERALLDGRVDLAVHSCKDLATAMPTGLVLAAVPVREDPRDALVSGVGTLEEMPQGASVGTGSPRRRGSLLALRGDLDIRPLRGNVPTRVTAVREGPLDATVLAVAGLKRLGMEAEITEVLPPEVMTPAAAQGALALQARSDDKDTLDLLRTLDDPESHASILAERACLRRLEAGCQAPVGAFAHLDGDRVQLIATVIAPTGSMSARQEALASDPEQAGHAAAEELLERLGLSSLRDASWAGPPPASPEES